MPEFRDIYYVLQKFRNFLLGRKHTLHVRFMPQIAPRTIPQPELTRAPEIKYSNNYYHDRDALNSVHPPIVAPIAEEPPLKQNPSDRVTVQFSGISPNNICFDKPPTPGPVWWWDGHCYYECKPECKPVAKPEIKPCN